MNDAVQKQEKPANILIGLVTFGVIFFAVWYGFDRWTGHKVASDAIEKYEIAQRNGDRSAACFQAGVAAASYLSAKEENAYMTWRVTEFKTCGSAIPDECMKRYDLSSSKGEALPRPEFCRRINP